MPSSSELRMWIAYLQSSVINVAFIYFLIFLFFFNLKGVILLEFVEATVDLTLPFKGSQ